MSANDSLRSHFDALAEGLFSELTGAETLSLWLDGEASAFVRFNRGRVRQPGSVRQQRLQLHLARGSKHGRLHVDLTGGLEADRQLVSQGVEELRGVLPSLPDDPHLLLGEDSFEVEQATEAALPAEDEVIDAVVSAAAGQDLVGIWASGPVCRGLATSRGQRGWFETATFSLDFCLYDRADKAVKASYAGHHFDRSALDDRVQAAARKLEVIRRPAHALKPGRYRAYLTPSAVLELLELLSWDGFSEKSIRTKQTSLLKMTEGKLLHPSIHLIEDTQAGYGPRFVRDGFLRPERVVLIDEGRLVGSLASPRTAAEYDTAITCDSSESPSNLAMATGDLPSDQVLKHLGDGLYISNLWYLNYSDPVAARITGMTRFATVWVQDGQAVAPVDVMRFDDTIYRMLGDNLEGLSDTAERFLDPETYGQRSTRASLVPGALLSGLQLTL